MSIYLFLYALGCSSKSSDTGTLDLPNDGINGCPVSGMDADVYMFATANFREEDYWYIEAVTVLGQASTIEVEFVPFDDSQQVSWFLDYQGQEDERDFWSQTILFSEATDLKEFDPYETYLIFWMRDQNSAVVDCAVLGVI